MPALRERGVIRHSALEPEPAEPPIRQVKVHLFTEPTLRPNPEAVADHEHSDHQLGIDRRPADAAVEGSELSPQFSELDEPIDRTNEMADRNMSLERELVEQRSLLDLSMSHHDLQSCASRRLNH
jgi:hypothetical protein